MEFAGFSQNKRNLYSEMKIFVTKKSSSFGIRQIIFLPTQSHISDESIPMISASSNSPDHLSFYFDLKKLKGAFNSKLAQTKLKISTRLKMTFEAKKTQDDEIETSLGSVYQLVKTFDSKMKSHASSVSKYLSENSATDRLDKCICVFLNTEFSKMIKQLKKEEQKFFSAVKNKKEKESASFFDFIDENHINEEKRVVYNDKGDKMVFTDISKSSQTEELTRMLDQINSLTDLLGQMNDLIIEQGTVVDRIDMNIEVTLDRTKKGNLELLSAKEDLEKGCVQKLLKFLIVANVIVFLLLMLKLR